MGAGQSIPQSLPSSQKYREKVVPAQNLVNDIFLWMARQVDTNDLIKLANPKACKDYVFLTKESLGILLNQIQLEPKLGQKNVMYFSSVKDLTFTDEKTAEQRPQQKLYRDALCAQLAFFYVRIFQVFGALALTVIDSLPDTGAQLVNIRAAALAPRPIGQAPLFPAKGGAQITAADRANLREFYDYASPYLVKADFDDDVYIIMEQAKGARRQFSKTTRDVIIFYPGKDNLIVYQTANNYLEASISIMGASKGTSYNLVIDNVQVNDEPLGVTYNVPMIFKTNDYFYPPRRSFADVLTAIVNAAIKPNLRNKTVEEILGERKDGKTDVKYDETGVPEGLSYLKIREYLKEKPKAYCVARAIQLLSPTLADASIQGARFGSDICYFTASEPYLKDSVPLFNHPITDNTPGIRALNQLFYDVLKGVTPLMSQQTEARYKEFLQIMHTIFSQRLEEKTLTKLQDVRSQPFTGCTTAQDKKIVLTTKNSIREVQKSVSELLNYQLRHTANVAKFMQKLFLIDKSGTVLGIHPTILKGGMPAVNKLAEDARILLTEYYKFCEGTYRIGALRVLAADNKILVDRKK